MLPHLNENQKIMLMKTQTRGFVLCLAALATLAAINVESHGAILSTFGNLGPAGGDEYDNTTNFLIGSSGTANVQIAVGFTPASPDRLLQSAQFWFGGPTNSPTVSVAVVTDNAGSPSNTVVATFSGISSITSETKYSFSTNTWLTAGTPYWLVVSQTTPSSSFSWFANNAGVPPSAQNGSGWTYGGVKRSQNGGTTWSTYNIAAAAAFTVNAVPEPSAYAMALVGMGCCGLTIWGRRRRD
jgi:hypothetical protein